MVLIQGGGGRHWAEDARWTYMDWWSLLEAGKSVGASVPGLTHGGSGTLPPSHHTQPHLHHTTQYLPAGMSLHLTALLLCVCVCMCV